MFFNNILKGMVIGVANIIPGVSGGTLALVLGIYERLINAIHNISLQTIRAFLGLLRFNKNAIHEFKVELERIDAYFLASILTGAVISIFSLAKLMTFFLEKFHDPTYGFFCGLVIVSAWVPFKLIKKHSISTFLAMVIAAAAVVAISSMSTDEQKINRAQVKHELQINKVKSAAVNSTSATDTESNLSLVKERPDHSPSRLLFMVLAGVIGISAMILPGISGSFLLLLMGVYFAILKSIIDFDILTLASFSLGMLIGLIATSHLLNYALKRWYDVTVSSLLGLVFGSMVAIWPFKGTAIVGGEMIYLSNKLPSGFGTNELATLIATLVGGGIVWVLICIEQKKDLQKAQESASSNQLSKKVETNVTIEQ